MGVQACGFAKAQKSQLTDTAGGGGNDPRIHVTYNVPSDFFSARRFYLLLLNQVPLNFFLYQTALLIFFQLYPLSPV